MKNRKNILYLLLVLAVFSCKKMPEGQTVSEEETSPIEFEPEVLTRSYITSAEDENFKAGMSIFATKSPLGTDRWKVIMDNVKLHDDDKDGVWTYQMDGESPYAYWGLNCDHYFLGIYPYKNKNDQNGQYKEENNIITLPSVSTITGLNTHNEGKNLGDDIMYGRAHMVFKIGDPIQKVQLKMQHALSAISINIRNGSEASAKPGDNDIVLISNIRLMNYITDVTDLKISKIDDSAPTWTVDPVRKTFLFDDYSQSIPQGDIQPKPIFASPAIVIPQDFTQNPPEQHLKLMFDAKFGDNAERKNIVVDLNTIELPNKNPKDKLKYLPGFHYKYNVEISSININCRVEIVPWKENKAIDLK